MHNMIIEDEAPFNDLNHDYLEDDVPAANVRRGPHIPLTFDRLMHDLVGIRSKELHYQLRDGLIEHLWSKHGDE